MPTVFRSPTTVPQFLNNAGQPNVGGTLLTQVGGINAATYQDAAGTTPLPNPIPLNSRGDVSNATGISCELFLTQGSTYTFTLFDALGNQIGQYPNINGIGDLTSSAAATIPYTPPGIGAITTNVATDLNNQAAPITRWGCIADGATDNTVMLQAAFNSGRQFFFVPQGQFNFSGTITVPNPITIYGSGLGSILACTVASQNAFLVTTTGAVNFFDLQCSSTIPKTSGYFIAFNPGATFQNNNSRIERCYFSFQFTAVDFERAAYWTMRSNYFTNNTANGQLVIARNLTTADSGDWVFAENKFFGGAGVSAFTINSGGGGIFSNNNFVQIGSALVLNMVAGSVTGKLTVVGNTFDGCTGSSVSLTTVDGTGSFKGIAIVGNTFDGAPSTAFIYASPVSGAGSIGISTICGNVFWQTGGSAEHIQLVNGGNWCVSGNTCVGTGGIVAIGIGVNVTDSVVGPNVMEGVIYSNSSTTTLLIDSNFSTQTLALGGKFNTAVAGSTIQQSAVIAPTLLNSWVNYASGTTPAGYYKDPFGTVYIRGRLKSGTVGTVLFNLPAGYRPANEIKMSCTENNAFASIKITTAGDVQEVIGSNTELSIDNCYFSTL